MTHTDDPIFAARFNHTQMRFLSFALRDGLVKDAIQQMTTVGNDSALHELQFCNHQREMFEDDCTLDKFASFCKANNITDLVAIEEIRYLCAGGFGLDYDADGFGVQPYPIVNIMSDENSGMARKILGVVH